MDGPVQVVRSRSNSVSSITSNTTQRLAYSSLQAKESLLWSLYECNLKILQSTYVRISADCHDREEFADIVKDFKDEVIRLRLWGREIDVQAMLVVERSKELRPVVTVLLQEIASNLLDRPCIRPPPDWRSHEYRKLRELHEKLNSITHVETDQGQYDTGSASPNLDFSSLEELVLDLRCFTSTLMDLVPVIEHTKDVLAKYVFRQHVSKVQQMGTRAQDDKMEADALEKTRAVSPKISRQRTKTGCLTCRKRRIKCGEERPTCTNCIRLKRICEGYNQRVVFKTPLDNFSSYNPSAVPSIHPTDNTDRISKTSEKTASSVLNRGPATDVVISTSKIVLAEPQNSNSEKSKITPPTLNTAYPDTSKEILRNDGHSDLEKPSSRIAVAKATKIASEDTCTKTDERCTDSSKKDDTFSETSMPPDSGEKTSQSKQNLDRSNTLEPRSRELRRTPSLEARQSPEGVDALTTQGTVSGNQSVPRFDMFEPYPDPDGLMCELCAMPLLHCMHSLSTTYIAPTRDFTDDSVFGNYDWPSHPPLLSLNPLPTNSASIEEYSPLLKDEPVVYNDANTVQIHVEGTYTLGDRLLQTHVEGTYMPGDRQLVTETKRRRPTPGGFPCTVEGCGKIFDRSCDLRRHGKTHLSRSERPYKCDVCGEGFLYPKDLKRHYRASHTEPSQSAKVLYCTIPGCANLDGFSRQDNLLRHQRKQHPKSVQNS